MCGIAGIIDPARDVPDLIEVVDAMTTSLRHRGPDDDGVWSDLHVGVALGHRRLSIVDLSREGRQPMRSADERFVITYNGEIYNHSDLRVQLDARGHRFRGTSDTEVLLAAIVEWGLLGALERSVGMFAFALWDARDRMMSLVRDRVGEKPLYYGRIGRATVFASELKAFREHPRFTAEIDRDSLASYFRRKYVPSPRSIYRGVCKLPPGCVLEVAADGTFTDPIRFWRPETIVAEGIADPYRGSEREAVEELDGLLREAVRIRMHADVPVGAFLSGGIDSSTVSALMQRVGNLPARTFTIGSTDPTYDEAPDARRVADHLGTDHTELYVTPEQAMEVIRELPRLYDEPFADSSQIPTFLVSELARRQVTVALSGDGGDELFGGYNRHLWVRRVADTAGRLPRPARRGASKLLTAISPGQWERVFDRLEGVLPDAARHRMAGDKMHKLASVLEADGVDDIYLRLTSHWSAPEALVLSSAEPSIDVPAVEASLSPAESLMYRDLVTYLPDDILAKVDRASMGVSLETRLPLLDHRVVSLAWRLPLATKIRNGQSKWVLRQVLQRYVPTALVDRPKMGFGVPIYAWLRGPLRSWAEELLDDARLRREGFLDATLVRRTWQEHLSGKLNRQYQLWDVLMFEAWLESQADATSGAVVGSVDA
jgi:asparagine synthase (glutamine-hydrolysing)